MVKKRIQVYADEETKRRIELAAAKYDLSVFIAITAGLPVLHSFWLRGSQLTNGSFYGSITLT